MTQDISLWDQWVQRVSGVPAAGMNDLAKNALATLPADQPIDVLHLGPGTGRDTLGMLQDARVQSLRAVDFSPVAVSVTTAAIAGVAKATKVIQKPIQQLDDADIGAPNLVLAQDVLMYLPEADQEKAIERIAGRLQQGGVFAGNISKLDGRLPGGQNIYAIDRDRVRKIFARHGLKAQYVPTGPDGRPAAANAKTYGFEFIAVKGGPA